MKICDKAQPEFVLGRAARAEELDGPLLFLARDAASYIPARHPLVDGG